jgi:hypothetical protein
MNSIVDWLIHLDWSWMANLVLLPALIIWIAFNVLRLLPWWSSNLDPFVNTINVAGSIGVGWLLLVRSGELTLGLRDLSIAANQEVLGPILLERVLLRPNNKEPPDYKLYVYLLIESAADRDKRISTLRAYACNIPAAGITPFSGQRAVFLLPVTNKVPGRLDLRDREKVRSAILNDDAYDFERAHSLMISLASLGRFTINPVGIFLIELDAPLSSSPKRGIAYDLSGLAVRDVANWILTERSNIEHGWTAGTPALERARPSWEAVFAGLGDLARNFVPFFPAAQASQKDPCL